jgi:hypothetical protein
MSTLSQLVFLSIIGPPAVAWPCCTWYANSRKRANHRLKLTGAAILVFWGSRLFQVAPAA